MATYPCGNCAFQSLRGFGVGWSVGAPIFSRLITRFQSLRGFGVGWSELANRAVEMIEGFNP